MRNYNRFIGWNGAVIDTILLFHYLSCSQLPIWYTTGRPGGGLGFFIQGMEMLVIRTVVLQWE